jgi:hypothetical protein
MKPPSSASRCTRRTRWATWSSSSCPKSAASYAEEGRAVAGVVESVKAAADIYMPVSAAKMVEVNEALKRRPGAGQHRPDGQRLVLQGPHVSDMSRVREADGPAGLRRAAEDPLTERRANHRKAQAMLMSALKPLDELEYTSEFVARHIGPFAGR